MHSRTVLVTALALLLAALAAEAAAQSRLSGSVAVSPGGTRGVEAAGSACPTFSWSAATGAAGYELVAYALEGDGSEAAAEPALRVSLPAGATSWSPSGSDCLAPGGSYGWTVRAEDSEGAGEWSAARFFRVPAGPSAGEVQEALTVLRRHLAEEGDDAAGRLLAELAAPAQADPAPPENGVAAAPKTLGATPQAAVASGDAALRGELPATSGVTYGMLGVTNSPDGAGLAGDNTAGGADLVLGGATPAQVTESSWLLDSAGAQSFQFLNPSGPMSLLVDGEEVLTGEVTGADVADGTLTFDDWSQNGCAGDQVPKWNGAAWACADDLGGGPATDVDCVGCVDATDLADGSGSGVDADLLDGLDSTDFADATHDHFGESWSGDDSIPGLEVENAGNSGIRGVTSAGLNAAGVVGRSTTSDSRGVYGLNSDTSGGGTGVFGDTFAPDGRGVYGFARDTTGAGVGVFAQARGASGIGVDAWANHIAGATIGVRGASSSPAGVGGLFINTNGGLLLAANDDFSTVGLEFSVDSDGNVVAGSFTGDGSGLTDLPAGDADTLDGIDSTGFALAGHDHGGETWSLNLDDAAGLRVDNQGTGAASALHGTVTSSSGVAVLGENSAVSGLNFGVRGNVASDEGIAVLGWATSPVSGIGVAGQSFGPLAEGVFGHNFATTGQAVGVRGVSSSTEGSGVVGFANAVTGTTTGVAGSADSPSGRGVVGHVTATNGTTVGVYGSSSSPDGTGGLFVNSEGGNLITGSDSFNLADPAEFVVAADGTVTATAFVGDGSGLTGLPSDADTLEGLGASSFLRSDASSAVGTGTLAFAIGTTLDVKKGTLEVGAMTKSGTGTVANLDADLLDGLDSTAFAAAGHDHFGQAWAGSGFRGLEVINSSTSPASFGLKGQSLAASGSTVGVVGESDSLSGIGVYGIVDESDPSSQAIGVLGQTSGSQGATVGVKGQAFSSDGVAVVGHAQSDGAMGGFFFNTGSGAAADRIVLAGADDSNRANLEFKVTASGDVYADGTYHCGPDIEDLDASGDLSEAELQPCLRDSSPADFAEMLPLGEPGVEAGDVLAVDETGRLVLTSSAFQPTVVGVRSTRPSYLGNNRFANDAGYAPLALTGLIPVKVTAENGAVRPGDLLVSSSTPGHAMRAGAEAPQGTVIGKALEPLAGEHGKVLMLAVLQ